MSGIAGFVRFRAPVAGIDLRLADAIAGRGHDGTATWTGDGAVLAHAQFRTTSASVREHQPYVDPVSGVVIVADTRLDSRSELADSPAPDGSDAAVIAAAWRRWGTAAPEHLDGDFAFAIWDPGTGTLFCARDRFGVKPLVYAELAGGAIAFASQPSALVRAGLVDRAADEQRVAEFLAVRFTDTRRTFYRGVTRLPGGMFLLGHERGIRTGRYWTPARSSTSSPPGGDLAEGLLHHLERAVSSRLDAPGPGMVAALFSGGLDSSSIACIAQDITRRTGVVRPPVFSWIFSDRVDADERAYQEAGAREADLDRHVLDTATEPFDPWSAFDRLLPDGPPYAPNTYLNYGAAVRARELGATILLDGLGGDSIVSHGRARLVELLARGRLLELRRVLGELSAREGASALRIFAANVAPRLLAPGPLELVQRVRGVAVSDGLDLLTRRARALVPHETPWRRTLSEEDEHRHQMESPLLADGLELFDRVHAAAGVEGRYPFFDVALFEYCASLPAEAKLANGYTRYVLRQAVAGLVPDVIRLRTTKGRPGLHVIAALRKSKARLDRIFLHDVDVLAPFVDVNALQDRYATLLESDRLPFPQVVQLWSCAALASWLRSASE